MSRGRVLELHDPPMDKVLEAVAKLFEKKPSGQATALRLVTELAGNRMVLLQRALGELEAGSSFDGTSV